MKTRLIIPLLIAASCCFTAIPALANSTSTFTWTFSDLTEQPTITLTTPPGVNYPSATHTVSTPCQTITGNSDLGLTGPVETCQFIETTKPASPGGHTPVITSVTGNLDAGELGFIADPGGAIVSDALIHGAVVGSPGVEANFYSDSNTGGGASCSNLPSAVPTPGCILTEDGTAKDGFSVLFDDGVAENFQVQSDVDPSVVPEPSTIALMISGVAPLAAGYLRRRRKGV